MKKLRWGVIGAGGIADRRTIPGMMLANNAELIAVMEINMELAEKSRAKWGCKRAYDSEAALLADPEIDAVYIASPVVLHAKQAMMAADAGKHILIEKPLAMTSEEGQKVVDYCESKGVKIAAGLMMRFGAYVMAMKQAIADGKIGRPVSGFSQFTCWYPDMPGNWRQSKKNGGGGAMMDMGVHCIDLMQYVTGSKVKQVAAFHDTLTFHYEVEDTSTVLMRLESGVLSSSAIRVIWLAKTSSARSTAVRWTRCSAARLAAMTHSRTPRTSKASSWTWSSAICTRARLSRSAIRS